MNKNLQHRRVSYSTFIGKIVEIFLNLILVIILSWILLIIYFFIKLWLFNDGFILHKITEITDVSLNVIRFIDYPFADKLIYYFKDWHKWFLLYLNYIVNPTLANNVISIVLGSFEIVATRAIVFVWSLPLLCLMHFVLIVDGLVQRDIRKFKAAKESTFFFHRVSSFTHAWLMTFFFIYMVIALPISPNLLLIPMIMGSAFLTMLSIKSYKKYL